VKWRTILPMLLIVFLYGMLNLTMGLRWGKSNADKWYAQHPVVREVQTFVPAPSECPPNQICMGSPLRKWLDVKPVPAPPKTLCDPGDIYLPASGGMLTCNDGRNAWRPVKNGEEVRK
jgi:hypothetical protein